MRCVDRNAAADRTRGGPDAPGRYRARDLLLPPGLISLARVPLAAAFPFVAERPVASFAVLAAAGVSDLLDGWWARRFGQETPTGAVLDGVTDKLFALTVALTLLADGHLGVAGLLLLGARDLGEIPLAAWTARTRRGGAAAASLVHANVAGKIATVLQFAAVAMVLLHAPYSDAAIAAAGVAGTLAALSYWRRALRERAAA